jgi:hypothetical protein
LQVSKQAEPISLFHGRDIFQKQGVEHIHLCNTVGCIYFIKGHLEFKPSETAVVAAIQVSANVRIGIISPLNIDKHIVGSGKV